jgi:hypothetical protein
LSGDRKEDHLAHAAWNVLGAIHSLEQWPDINKDLLRGPGCATPPAATASAVAPVERLTPAVDGLDALRAVLEQAK